MTRTLRWIDEICIDQSNFAEKNEQVRMMSDIYRNCEHVIVWLGCETDMIDSAATFVSTESTCTQEEKESAMTSMLTHRYFERLWIVQELLLAPEIHVLTGPNWVTWSDLQYYWDNYFTVPDDWSSLQSATELLSDEKSYYHHRLDWLSFKYSGQGCMNERDKIYGLLGLVQEENRIEVDYAKSIIDVYLDAMLAIFTHHETIHHFFQGVCSSLAQNMGFTPDMLKLVQSNVACNRSISPADRWATLRKRLKDIAPARFTRKGVAVGTVGGPGTSWWPKYLYSRFSRWAKGV